MAAPAAALTEDGKVCAHIARGSLCSTVRLLVVVEFWSSTSSHLPYHFCHPQHKLQNEWAMWELRKKDRESGIGVKDWNELPLKLYTFKTVEDFWMCWKRTPQIT